MTDADPASPAAAQGGTQAASAPNAAAPNAAVRGAGGSAPDARAPWNAAAGRAARSASGAAAAPPRHGRPADVSASAIAAGFLAVLVSASGPLLIFLQASRAMETPPEVFTSWVFAIFMGAGVTSIGLSWWLRTPVATAWSAPGTVLLISIGTGIPFDQIVGAYLVTAAVLLLIGIFDLFDRLARLIPASVADGMMAGILFGFGMKAMGGLATAPVFFAALLTAFLVFNALIPRVAVALLLGIALGLAWLQDGEAFAQVGLALAEPRLTWPAFSTEAILGLSAPLIITTLTGQYLPGMAVLRAQGYEGPAHAHVRARPMILANSLVSLPSALLGGMTTALAAITQAICAGPDAHPDPGRRWVAGAANGGFYILGAIFAGSIVQLLTAVPAEAIALLAGLALLGAIMAGMVKTLTAPAHARAGLLAFMVTVSGVALWDIGSAFWGVAVGALAVAAEQAALRLKAALR